MTDPFSKLIKSLKREVLEIKNAPRRSTLTLETVTKSITVQQTATTDGNGYAYAHTLPLINIKFNSDLPQIFMAASESTTPASPFRFDGFFPLSKEAPDEAGIIIDAAAIFGAAANTTYTVNIKVYITATGDFTLTASTIGN